MAKKARHTITKEQIHKLNRKVSREENLGDGWVASHRVHASKKTYNRNEKHKGLN